MTIFRRRSFQSTRPRGTRLTLSCQRRQARGVSIHASARDATLSANMPGDGSWVSIHASARDATARSSPLPLQSCFNPRVRAGRDPFDEPLSEESVEFQSTRPRGTRRPCLLYQIRHFAFQSTRPRGTRPRQSKDLTEELEFQSTRPRGTRQRLLLRLCRVCGVSIHASARDATHSASISHTRSGFNPRVRAGRDADFGSRLRAFTVSIHASARDATRDPCVMPLWHQVSIHASARDATPCRRAQQAQICFNPRVRAGRDIGA